MASISRRVEVVKADPARVVDPRVVQRECAAVGYQWRERTLGPVETLQAFVAQIAHGNTAIPHVVRLMGGAFSQAAYCQARARLPVDVVRAVAQDVAAQADASEGRWCGHRTALVDGTGVVMPDTPPLRQKFGVAAGYAPGCGLPLMSLLCVFDAGTDKLLDLHPAPAHTHDAAHVSDLHPALAPGDVLVGDSAFCSYTHLAELDRQGVFGVFRMSGSRSMPFPAKSGQRERHTYNRHRRHEPILVRAITENDQIVELAKPHNRPSRMSQERFAALPPTLVVRALRYRVEARGWRSEEITLLTTLMDPERYTADDLAELYLSRWRIEVNLRHLKRTMGMERLKCETVDGIMRELWVFALVYNVVCQVRAKAAEAQNVELGRVGFIDALRWLLIATGGTLATMPCPPDLKVWPTRRRASEPRYIKRRNQSFKVMGASRAEMKRTGTN